MERNLMIELRRVSQLTRCLWAALISVALLPTGLAGQQIGAIVTGHVYDASGAAVPGATITARSVATGAVFAAESDAVGLYQLPFLNPGEYGITVEKQGFRKIVRGGVTLTVAQKAVLDFTLELGAVAQSVTVTANSPILETESGDRGWTIGPERLSNIPQRGLNVTESTWFSPGVTVTGSVTKLRPFDIAGTGGVSISGGSVAGGTGNLILVDGVSANRQASGAAFVPIADSTQEITLQTTMYDAQYGWSTGGVVNMVSRGGTNAYHGEAYEYLQNTHLNANHWHLNRAGQPRLPWHINMFGGSVGGPIVKNKLFFLFAYQNIRQVQPDSFTTAVPPMAIRGGDFSQTFFAPGQLQVIYDPTTTRVGPNGQLIRDPFKGNTILSGMINPVAKAVLALIPPPNQPGGFLGAGNLVNTSSTRKFVDHFPEYSARGDYNLSEKTHLFFRFSQNHLSETRSYKYSTTSSLNIAETSANSPFQRVNHDYTFQLTHAFSPTTVLEFRTGMNRFVGGSGSDISAGFDLSSLSFSSTFVGEAGKFFPRFSWSGYEGAGSNPFEFGPVDLTQSNEVVLAKTRGRHNMRFGMQFMYLGTNDVNPGFIAGNFSFTGTFTTANPLQQSPSSGNAIADFLLGFPASGFIQINSNPALSERLWSFFGQDDFHISRSLTLNAGLRWDYLGPLSGRFNALTRGFCFTCPSPLQVPGVNLQGGLIFAGAGGSPRGIYNRQLANFGPRVGFAYQLRPATVLRGGFGIIYGAIQDNPGAAPGFSQTTPMVSSIQTGIPFNTLTNPFPDGILKPVGSSLGLAQNLGQGVSFADPDMNIPRTLQYSFEIQHRFGENWMATAAYVGSHADRLPVSRQLNFLSLQSLALGAKALTTSVPNPFLPAASLLKGTSLAALTVQQQQLLLAYPQFTSVVESFIPIGKSNFNSLQLELIKRFSRGLDLGVAYTWEKTLQAISFENAQDASLERVVTPFDVRNQLKLSGVWQLPFGPGRRFGTGASPLVRRLVGGWSVSGIARAQTGMPMNFPSGAAPTGAPEAIPNSSINRWFNTCTLLPPKPDGTIPPPRGCVGNELQAWTIRAPSPSLQALQGWSSLLDSIRRPGIDNLDLALSKRTEIKERYALTFRADFINATNTTQWFNGPDTNVNNSGTFGKIAGFSNQSNDPRVIMLSLKLEF